MSLLITVVLCVASAAAGAFWARFATWDEAFGLGRKAGRVELLLEQTEARCADLRQSMTPRGK